MSKRKGKENLELQVVLEGEGVRQPDDLAVYAGVLVADVGVGEVVDAVVEGPGSAMALEELKACSEVEGEVEVGAIEDGNVAWGDEESCVEEGIGLQAVGGGEVEALAERAETAGIGPARAAGLSFSHGLARKDSTGVRDRG